MLERALLAFSYPDLHNAAMVYNRLLQTGHTIEELIKYIDQLEIKRITAIATVESNNRKAESDWLRLAPECPDCGSPLMLAAVKTRPGKANLYGYRSLMFCSNNNCLYEKYSRISADYRYRKLLREAKQKEEKEDGS